LLFFMALANAFAVQGQEIPAAPVPTDAEILALLKDRLDPRADVGLVAAMITPAGAIIVSAGKAGPDGIPLLNGDTVFEIGSVTKVFTAVALADMIERGEVALDDPVQKFLPTGARVPERNGKPITLLDLTTHTSGLPSLPTNLELSDMANPYARYTVPQLYTFLNDYKLTRDIGSAFEYSNFGVGLLGHALALRTGKSYEEMVRSRILQPLGMKDTGITLSDSMRQRLAVGHNGEGSPVPNWDLPTLAGAGALRSSANDMVKFVQANLADTGPRATALRRSRGRQRNAGKPDMNIGLGWIITKTPTAEIVWHNGGTGGYHSFMGLDLEKKTGVLILYNTSADIDDIGFYLLDSQLPRPVKRRVEIELKAEALAPMAGEYQIVPGFTQIPLISRFGERIFPQDHRRPGHVRQGCLRAGGEACFAPGWP
jgi:D-alanyl-D-alanine-carboxypeptidase/D-alanyl-D-alanine-endopeptidase